MRFGILAIRALETLFLVVFVVTFTVTPDGVTRTTHFASVSFAFWIRAAPETVVLSSILIGYVFSVLGTLMRWKTSGNTLRAISIGLASCGIFACLNEFARLFVGYSLQILLHFPIALVVVDWLMLRGPREQPQLRDPWKSPTTERTDSR